MTLRQSSGQLRLSEHTQQSTNDTPVLAQNTQPQVRGEQSATQVAVIDPEDVDPADIDWAAISERSFPGIDQMILRWNVPVDYSEAEIAAFNKLHVVPFNPRVDEVCYDRNTGIDGVGENGDGMVKTCDQVRKFPEHEYESLDLETLVDLAENDAVAAVFASRKANELPLKLGLTLRAVALSEKSGPLLELREREFHSITEEGDDRSKEDVINDLAHRMILDRLADVLGDPRAKPDEMVPHIREIASDAQNAEEILQAIDKAVDRTLKELADIQRETTGSTQIWELTNA